MPKGESRIFRVETIKGKKYRVMYYWDPRIKGWRKSKFIRPLDSDGKKKKKMTTLKNVTGSNSQVVPKQVQKQPPPPPQKPVQRRILGRTYRSSAADRLINAYSNLGR